MSEPKMSAPTLEPVQDVDLGGLCDAVAARARERLRFLTMTCIDLGDDFELIYHFDRDGRLEHLRTRASRTADIPSITGQYFCAFLVENEVVELFGAHIRGMAIDYGGRLLTTEDTPRHPMARATADGQGGGQ